MKLLKIGIVKIILVSIIYIIDIFLYLYIRFSSYEFRINFFNNIIILLLFIIPVILVFNMVIKYNKIKNNFLKNFINIILKIVMLIIIFIVIFYLIIFRPAERETVIQAKNGQKFIFVEKTFLLSNTIIVYYDLKILRKHSHVNVVTEGFFNPFLMKMYNINYLNNKMIITYPERNESKEFSGTLELEFN